MPDLGLRLGWLNGRVRIPAASLGHWLGFAGARTHTYPGLSPCWVEFDGDSPPGQNQQGGMPPGPPGQGSGEHSPTVLLEDFPKLSKDFVLPLICLE